MARRADVLVPKTKAVVALFDLLVKSGYAQKLEVIDREIKITLKYNQKVPALIDLNRISKPGRRVYVNKNHLPKVLGGQGISIISTPLGLLTDKEAKTKGIGGEVICEIW